MCRSRNAPKSKPSLLLMLVAALIAASAALFSSDATAQGLSAPNPIPFNFSYPDLPRAGNEYEGRRLFIFISASVPTEIIRTYMADAEPVAERVVFVLRGFVENRLSIAPTLEYVRELLCGEEDFGSKACYTFIVDINPSLFETFGVDRVPAVVLVEEDVSGTGCGPELPDTYYVSFGDAPLAYHLSLMAKRGSKTAETLLRSLKKSFYD